MWLPDWLYRVLPLIYILSGVTAIYHGENLIGQGSGLILIFTAILVWKLRKECRSRPGSRHCIK